MKKTANKDFRYLTIILLLVVGFFIGYIGRGYADKPAGQTIEQTAIVYEVSEDTTTFETADGNLWSACTEDTDLTEGDTVIVAFTENYEIIEIKG